MLKLSSFNVVVVDDVIEYRTQQFTQTLMLFS